MLRWRKKFLRKKSKFVCSISMHGTKEMLEIEVEHRKFGPVPLTPL